MLEAAQQWDGAPLTLSFPVTRMVELWRKEQFRSNHRGPQCTHVLEKHQVQVISLGSAF